MLTLVWLIAWLLSNTPHVAHWNNWMIALVVCLAIDVIKHFATVKDPWA